MLDKEKISEIKNAINIVDVIGESVSLKKIGRNYLGLCPFHNEKTASFNVVEDKQFYHCFGCGRSGDVFNFMQEYLNIPFSDTVQLLAERSGIVVELGSNQDSLIGHPHQKLYSIHKESAKFYHAVLMTTKMGDAARKYLYSRGLTDEVIRYFQIGLSPDKLDFLYKSMVEKFDEETIYNSGLFHISQTNAVYDAFQNRIMFPVMDSVGRVVAFSGRIWDGDLTKEIRTKYKNSRRTPIFNKGLELYHLNQAKTIMRKEHEVYIVEGFMDVIAAYRSGILNVVASMGTTLTREHARHLNRYVKKVILTYDGDQAGQIAMEKNLKVLRRFEIEVVRIPGNMDPDEYIAQNAPEDLKKLFEETRISIVEFLIHHLKPNNIENLQTQIEFVDRMAPIIRQTSSVTAKNAYISMLADILPDFTYHQIELTINDSKNDRHDRLEGSPDKQRPIYEIAMMKPSSRLTKTENYILHRMIHDPCILNSYRLRPEFRFETSELQILYNILKKNGEVLSQDLAAQTANVREAWYRVLEENLPTEVKNGELEEVEKTREAELLKKENRFIGQKVKSASQAGDDDLAIRELNRLISRRRRME